MRGSSTRKRLKRRLKSASNDFYYLVFTLICALIAAAAIVKILGLF